MVEELNAYLWRSKLKMLTLPLEEQKYCQGFSSLEELTLLRMLTYGRVGTVKSADL